MEYLTLEEERQRQLHARTTEKSRAEQLTATIESVQRQISGQKTKALSDVLAQVEDLNKQHQALRQELVKLDHIREKLVLESPVDGTLKGLNITTVG